LASFLISDRIIAAKHYPVSSLKCLFPSLGFELQRPSGCPSDEALVRLPR